MALIINILNEDGDTSIIIAIIIQEGCRLNWRWECLMSPHLQFKVLGVLKVEIIAPRIAASVILPPQRHRLIIEAPHHHH